MAFSHDTESKIKQTKLNQDIIDFLEKGGQIQQFPAGSTGLKDASLATKLEEKRKRCSRKAKKIIPPLWTIDYIKKKNKQKKEHDNDRVFV